MKNFKKIVMLTVLLTFLSCGDDLIGPFGDLTPPRGGWLWVVKNSNSSAIYKVDLSTLKWTEQIRAPIRDARVRRPDFRELDRSY